MIVFRGVRLFGFFETVKSIMMSLSAYLTFSYSSLDSQFFPYESLRSYRSFAKPQYVMLRCWQQVISAHGSINFVYDLYVA